MKTKKQLSLVILESAGRNAKFERDYPGRPVVLMNRFHCSFSYVAEKELKLKMGDGGIWAKDGKDIYYGILPPDSNLNGYSISYINKNLCVRSFGLQEGIYELQKPISQNGVKWYLLKKLVTRETTTWK